MSFLHCSRALLIRGGPRLVYFLIFFLEKKNLRNPNRFLRDKHGLNSLWRFPQDSFSISGFLIHGLLLPGLLHFSAMFSNIFSHYKPTNLVSTPFWEKFQIYKTALGASNNACRRRWPCGPSRCLQHQPPLF